MSKSFAHPTSPRSLLRSASVASRRIISIMLLLAAAALAACGGGSDGDEATPAPVIPGSLHVLAVEGSPAPGTVGNFAGLDASDPMDVWADGWSVFAADTTDAIKSEVLYVGSPTDGLTEVAAVGDSALAPSDGTIAAFLGCWIRNSQRVVYAVAITGDTGARTFGVYSVSVTGGTVGTTNVLFHDGDTLAGAASTLTTFGIENTQIADDGTFFTVAILANTNADLYRITFDGSVQQRLIGTGDGLPNARVCQRVVAFGIDAIGGKYGFIAVDLGSGLEYAYTGVIGVAGYAEILAPGVAITAQQGGGTVLDVYSDASGGGIIMYASGSMVWKGTGSVGGTDDLLIIANANTASLLSRTGGVATGQIAAFIGTIAPLQMQVEVANPSYSGIITQATNGGTFATQAIVNGPAFTSWEGRSLAGSTLTTNYLASPGAGNIAVSRNSSFAYGNLLANGTSGLFWLVVGQTTFAVALEGGAAPGGDTFGAFNPCRLTVANNNVLFRAPLDMQGSAVLRQGP